jgi:hypothetical protein
LSTLAAATRRGEFCVVVDGSDALDPHSAAAAGVELDRLLWVRCGESSPQKESSPRKRRDTEKNSLKNQIQSPSKNQENRLEQVLRATDLLLESGGFGLIVLDLADLPTQAARHIPLTTWFRFRRVIEHTLTILLAIEQNPIAGSCSSLLLQLGSPSDQPPSKCRREAVSWQSDSSREEYSYSQNVESTHAHLLTGLEINAELIRSRLYRRPARSVTFATKTAWVG